MDYPLGEYGGNNIFRPLSTQDVFWRETLVNIDFTRSFFFVRMSDWESIKYLRRVSVFKWMISGGGGGTGLRTIQ
jgi:hypothetical protein